MRVDKYLDFIYSKEIKELLLKTDLTIKDKTNIHIIKENCKESSFYYIIDDLYRLVKNNFSTKQISQIYDVGDRMVQIWLKEMGLNRHSGNRKENQEYNRINIQNEVEVKSLDLKDKQFCLYRFLDKDRNILYIGKCEKSYHSDGRGGKKEYFIKDRLQQHFSPSSKQLPKSLYLNIKYIEICFPDVNNGEELEIVENQLISYYEREKLQCHYNLYMMMGLEYISSDTMKWTLYEEKSDKDIKILMKKYNYDKIPPIEIINERLRTAIWILNNKYKEEC